jgi:DNA polymerase-1
MDKKRLIIIDSNALLHRSFHALPPLATKLGQETGAVYGYLLTLFKAIKDLQPEYIVATFDTKAKTFRHEKFQDYKAQRPVTPSGIISQIPIAKEVLQSFKIPVFAVEGFEADDLIATICALALNIEKNIEIYILSGDLDNLQLVNENIKVYTLGKGIKDTVIYDINKVIERFGVKPEQMNDFKALTGDASDNIPGVPGIGKKTASEIIQKYKNIKNLYEELSTDTAVLKPKVKEALKKNKESAFMSRELVETKKDVDINFNLLECKFGNFDQKEVENQFKKLEFDSLINRLISLNSNN